MHAGITEEVNRVRLVKEGRELQEVYGRLGFGFAFTKDLKAIAYAAIDALDEKDDMK